MSYPRSDAIGNLGGHSYRIQAVSPALGTTAFPIWDVVGAFNWIDPTGIGLQVSSSAAADTLAGTGARTVRVTGLSAAGAAQTAIVNLDGQTAAVIPTLEWISVERVEVMAVGTGGANAGDIYVSDAAAVLVAGVPNVATEVRAKILVGNGRSLSAAFVVPAGRSFLPTQIVVTTEAAQAGTLWRLMYKTPATGIRVYTARMQFGVATPWAPEHIDSIPGLSQVWIDAANVSETNMVVTAEMYGGLA